MAGPAIPTSIVKALESGKVEDIDAARQWLVSKDRGTNDLSSVLWDAAVHTVHCDRRVAEAKLRFVELALTRGADPNRMFTISNLQTAGQTHEINMVCTISELPGWSSSRLIALLIRWGAGIDHRASKITKMLEDGGKEVYRYSPLAYAILYASKFRRRQHRAVAIALLRAGASLDAVATISVYDAQWNQGTSRSESIEWALGEKERRDPSLVNNAHYLAFKAFLLSVRAAGGYRSFVIEQSRTCALMRHLALRDRATTRDGALKFLARTGERGLFRRVLSYLSPPPPPQPTTYLNLRVMWKENGEETFFKLIRSTTPLMRMFRAYAPKASGYLEEEVHVTQLVFYLPGSEERIEEGWQTGDDLGLEDGDTIMCEPYAGSLVCIRDQIVVVKQKIALVEADQRYLSAENAEEAVACAAAAEAARRVAARE